MPVPRLCYLGLIMPRNISTGSRADAYRRSGRQCWYCGCSPATEVEHLTPYAKAGGSGKNLVGACRPCNADKKREGVRGEGNFNLKDYRWLVARRYGVTPETIKFYGERLEAARQVAALNHPAHRALIVAGWKDELVELPSSVDIRHSVIAYSPRSKPIEW